MGVIFSVFAATENLIAKATGFNMKMLDLLNWDCKDTYSYGYLLFVVF